MAVAAVDLSSCVGDSLVFELLNGSSVVEVRIGVAECYLYWLVGFFFL